MKTHYVYELYNELGSIEHVGETSNPKKRFYNHTKAKPIKGTGTGKFYKRLDISMNIVKEFYDKKEAFAYQCELQKQYGLITDKDKFLAPTSEETKLKMSLAKLGKKHPQWVKDKIKATMLSKKHNDI
jgi:predicted GIY-YIG superfamily endonuclease